MTAKRPPDKAPAKAGAIAEIPALEEINLCFNAREYGEVEPLLARLVSHGLESVEARRVVADLARGVTPRARRSRERVDRDALIRLLVANRRGLLKREGKDPRRAVTLVAKILQGGDDDMDRRQVARIWEARQRSMILGEAYRLGLEGIEVDISSR